MEPEREAVVLLAMCEQVIWKFEFYKIIIFPVFVIVTVILRSIDHHVDDHCQHWLFSFWNDHHHSNNHRIWLQWSQSPLPLQDMKKNHQRYNHCKNQQLHLVSRSEQDCSRGKENLKVCWKILVDEKKNNQKSPKNNQKSPAEETFSFSFPAFTLTLTLAATLGNMSKIIIITRILRTLIGDRHSERWSLEISDEKTCLAMLIQYSRIWELYKGVESNTLYYDTTKS